MELDHTVYPPQAWIPTKRGEKSAKGQCLSCTSKWTAVGSPCPCPVCAVGWPDHIAERLKADQPPTALRATPAKP